MFAPGTGCYGQLVIYTMQGISRYPRDTVSG